MFRIQQYDYPSTLQNFKSFNNNSAMPTISSCLRLYEEDTVYTTNYTMIEDYDYIGNGGFVLECRDGECLGITKEQASKIRESSEFFDNCFRHGTIEASEGVIRKPDWSLGIVRHLIEVLTKKQTTVSSLEIFQELMGAADQACLDLRLCSMVNYTDPALSVDSKSKFLDLVDEEKYCFTFRANVKSCEWLQLLEEDVLLYRSETNYAVRLCGDDLPSREPDASSRSAAARRNLDERISHFRVHAHRAIEAVTKIEGIISQVMRRNCTSMSAPTEEASVYFETSEPLSKDYHDLIDRLGGGEACIRTCADSESKNTEGYTIRGSFDVLLRAIQPILISKEGEVDIVTPCSLRIDYPTPDTLGRFINACQEAKDYPNTICMDAAMGRYFCRKSIRDIELMLSYLADFSTSSIVKKGFTVFEYSSEDKQF